MSDFTQYKKLELPKSPERYDIQVFNKNNLIIDSELHKLDIKNQSQDNLLATNEALNAEISRSISKENDIISSLNSEISRAKSAENKLTSDLESEISRASTAETNFNINLQNHISNESNPHNVTKSQVGLGNADNTSDMDKPVSTAQQTALNSAISTHNTSSSSHSDMRLLISELTARLNALADSDDTTLDQLSEIVAYIKNNKSLIDGITTNKVNVSDIIDDLTTNSDKKVLSAKQGQILKEMIISLTKDDIGLGNVENKSSATIRSELTKENVTNALGYTPPTTNTTYSASNTTPKANGTASAGTESAYARGDHVHPSQTSISGNAGTASKWATARNIDGMSIQGDVNRTTYGTCSTAAGTVGKVVECAGFALVTGARIDVRFTVTNTAANPTLNVNNTGAKSIYYRGSAIAAGYLAANRTYSFRYNGTQWDLVGDLNTNTTYGVVSTSANGLCPKRDGSTDTFLRGDGTWAVPKGGGNITYSDTEPTSLVNGMTWIGSK